MQQQQRPRGSGGPVLYQIDFTAVAAGKRVPSSKRRVRWYVVRRKTIYTENDFYWLNVTVSRTRTRTLS